MAQTKSVRPTQQTKVFYGLVLLSLMSLLQIACAREFVIGGLQGWSVPSDINSKNYNQWAEKNRFQVGDSILFVYPAEQDSVLQVNSDAYVKCDTDNPMAKYSSGRTSITFKQSGPHYFISGNKENCDKNEKVVVIVLADRNTKSPPPTTEDVPSPPDTGSIETIPAPTEDNHPPNAASSVFIGGIGSIGAFLASYLVLMF